MPPIDRALRPLCLLLALLTAVPAVAGSTAVFPPQATNLDPGPAEAVGQLLAHEYGLASGQPMLLPAQAGGAVQPGASLAAAAAALGADEYLDTTAIGLEHGMLVTATRFRRDGTPVYSAQMRAQSLEDLPEVAARLARALYEQRSPEQTRTVDTVTLREAQQPNRLATQRVVGFKTSASRPLGSKFESIVSVGFDGRYELERYFLEFGFGFLAPSDTSASRVGYGGLYSEFGGSYYLTRSDIAPYFGVGVTPRLLFGADNDSPTNLGLWGQLGVMFWRTSSTRLYLDLRLTQNLFGLQTGGGFADASRSTLYPTELGLALGMGW